MNGKRVGIAGVGLIGGSIALRARAVGANVLGYDRDPQTVQLALERGVIERAEPDLRALAAGSDILVIALPIDATATALDALADQFGPELVIDVASVKAPFISRAARVRNYIGTHPMAGRERGGIDAAQAGLFEAATWAYTPHPDPQLSQRVLGFIAAMGARPLAVDAVRHDAIVALTSHLPQALAVALAAQIGAASRADESVTELCGPGIRSMLRLARSPAALWSPIVTANAAALARQLRSTAHALGVAADGLERGDSAPLMSYFEVAHDVTAALDERFGPNSRS